MLLNACGAPEPAHENRTADRIVPRATPDGAPPVHPPTGTAPTEPAGGLSPEVQELVQQLEESQRRAASELHAEGPTVEDTLQGFFEALVAADRNRAFTYMLGPDEVRSHYVAGIAGIMVPGLERSFDDSYGHFQGVMKFGAAQLVGITSDPVAHVEPATHSNLRQPAWLVPRAQIEFDVGGARRTLRVESLLRTERGWRMLSFSL